MAASVARERPPERRAADRRARRLEEIISLGEKGIGPAERRMGGRGEKVRIGPMPTCLHAYMHTRYMNMCFWAGWF